MEMISKDAFRFWKWVFSGIKDNNGVSSSGLKQFIDVWLILHILLSVLSSSLLAGNFLRFSQTVVFPLISALMGISLAWIGTSISIVTSNELRLFMKSHPGGVVTLIYTYQLAILVLVVTLALWYIPSFITVGSLPPFLTKKSVLSITRFCLMLCLSISIRECWHVIKQTSSAMIAYIAVKERE